MSEENKQEREQKAVEIVTEVLQLLASKNLSMQDARRIIHATEHVAVKILHNFEDTTVISVPKDVAWKCTVPLPTFTDQIR